jgi:hypothetical protein
VTATAARPALPRRIPFDPQTADLMFMLVSRRSDILALKGDSPFGDGHRAASARSSILGRGLFSTHSLDGPLLESHDRSTARSPVAGGVG